MEYMHYGCVKMMLCNGQVNINLAIVMLRHRKINATCSPTYTLWIFRNVWFGVSTESRVIGVFQTKEDRT